ncbi:MAG TPA: TetR/AcrR family transcriptional regulator [Burkholderiales bacterium]|nr:TetR/AcrR family transcriptional regulator [Burkholderiales bacterium]
MPSSNTTDVRSRILEAALELLGDHGVSKLTQPSVAKAAGVRQSHLTYYFPTRADLLKATALHSIEVMIGMLAARASEGQLSPDMLAQIASTMVSDKRRARVVLGLVVASDEDREIKGFLRDFVARVRADIGRVVELLGREADPENIALFHTLIVGAAVLHIARDNTASRRESALIVRYAVEQLLLGEPRTMAAE